MLAMFLKMRNDRKGFTLVELLVVVAIIGILAAIAIPKFSSANAAAARSKIQADLRTLDSAAAIYYASAQSYPANVAALASGGKFLASTPTTPSVTLSGATIASGLAYAFDASGRAIITGFTFTSDNVPVLP